MNIQTNGWQNYVQVEPIKAKFYDTEDCTQLFITSVTDNVYDSAVIQWELRTAPVEEVRDIEGNITTPGKSGVTHTRSTHAISGDDYTSWGIDNTYIYEIICTHLGLSAI